MCNLYRSVLKEIKEIKMVTTASSALSARRSFRVPEYTSDRHPARPVMEAAGPHWGAEFQDSKIESVLNHLGYEMSFPSFPRCRAILVSSERVAIAKKPPKLEPARKTARTVRVCTRIPDSVDQLIIAVEVSRIILQVLGRGSSEENREARKLNITCPIVDETQISKATPCMLTIDCISPSSLPNWKISIAL